MVNMVGRMSRWWRRLTGGGVETTASIELPEDHWIYRAHGESRLNRGQIEASHLCGCFCCESTFKATDITEWSDANQPQEYWTANCPLCHVDSVIGDSSDFEISEIFLAQMKQYWFDGLPPQGLEE